jgi:hypothetical protein
MQRRPETRDPHDAASSRVTTLVSYWRALKSHTNPQVTGH